MAGLVGYGGSAPTPGSTKQIHHDVYSVTFQVSALTATFGDVTAVGLPWARPGDVFTWNPTTRLAGCGLIDINCATAGTLTGRFFGTTGGGDYVVDVCRTSRPA